MPDRSRRGRAPPTLAISRELLATSREGCAAERHRLPPPESRHWTSPQPQPGGLHSKVRTRWGKQPGTGSSPKDALIATGKAKRSLLRLWHRMCHGAFCMSLGADVGRRLEPTDPELVVGIRPGERGRDPRRGRRAQGRAFRHELERKKSADRGGAE